MNVQNFAKTLMDSVGLYNYGQPNCNCCEKTPTMKIVWFGAGMYFSINLKLEVVFSIGTDTWMKTCK